MRLIDAVRCTSCGATWEFEVLDRWLEWVDQTHICTAQANDKYVASLVAKHNMGPIPQIRKWLSKKYMGKKF